MTATNSARRSRSDLEYTPPSPASIARTFVARVSSDIDRQLHERSLSGGMRELHEMYAEAGRMIGAEDHGGLFLPNPYALLATRAGLDTASSTKGAELVFKQEGDYVGPESPLGILASLATIIDSDKQADHIKQTGRLNPDVDWGTENPGSDVSDSTFTFSLTQARPRDLIASVTASRQLLATSRRAQDAISRELLRATATKIEAGAFNGNGSAPNPRGVLNTSGITTLAVGTDGGSISAALLAKMPRALGENGALFADSVLAYITTPAVKTEAMQLPRGTGTEVVWHSDDDVFGQRGFGTTNVPSNLTKGTSTTVCHAILFGDWSQLYLHVSPQIEIVVDPYRLKKQGMVEISSYMLADVAIPRPAAFIAIKDVTVPAL